MLCNLAQPLERSKTERQSLRSASYPDKASHRPILAILFHTDIRKRILAYNSQYKLSDITKGVVLTKHTPRVQVRAQELTIATQTRLGRQTAHIRNLHQPTQKVS